MMPSRYCVTEPNTVSTWVSILFLFFFAERWWWWRNAALAAHYYSRCGSKVVALSTGRVPLLTTQLCSLHDARPWLQCRRVACGQLVRAFRVRAVVFVVNVSKFDSFRDVAGHLVLLTAGCTPAYIGPVACSREVHKAASNDRSANIYDIGGHWFSCFNGRPIPAQ